MHYDADFLASLDRQSNKTIYVKLISLTYDEQPIEAIEGRAMSGSVNIDGNSAVRRTCQISLVTDTLNISDYYWTLKTKFKVQIGVENTVTASPKIVWFDQGIYVISSFSTAYSSNSYTVNISGKDKMCLLNGEIGGTIAVSTDFGKIDETKTLETGEIIVETKSLKIVDVLNTDSLGDLEIYIKGDTMYLQMVDSQYLGNELIDQLQVLPSTSFSFHVPVGLLSLLEPTEAEINYDLELKFPNINTNENERLDSILMGHS